MKKSFFIKTTSTGNVTNTLNNCVVENDFFGGGRLGKVDGNVTSTLDGCTVLGNVLCCATSFVAATRVLG
ncbi:MAG: hypothetical protein K6A67_05450 [Bacteroidales bacterium]|nr:hypothetical protein [Bacteroidales bacterium]